MSAKLTLALWALQIPEPLGRMQMKRQHCAGKTEEEAAEHQENAPASSPISRLPPRKHEPA